MKIKTFFVRSLALSAALLLSITAIVAQAQTPAWPDAPDKIAILKAKVDARWPGFSGEPKPKTDVREMMSFALNAAAVDFPPERIGHVLKYLRQAQVSDEKKKGYGNFIWYWGDSEVVDFNGVEFTIRQGVLIWILYRDKLSPDARKTLEDMLVLAVEGVKRQKVNLNYTNIITMKIWNLIALGEALDKPDVADLGYKLLDDWMLFTYRNGICEYLSPTYYECDLENLGLIYHFAKREEGRTAAKAALDYIWTDIMANWYSPSMRLGGAHSRDYDRLTGHGGLEKYPMYAGFIPNSSGQDFRNSPFDYFSFVQPSAEIGKLADTIPRFVFQRWGDKPWQWAAQYVGKNFSVGSAGCNYWDMDKAPLLINIGSGERTSQINFYMDGRGDCYGRKKIMEGSGHMKALHLRPFITSVQNDADVLFLTSISAKKTPEMAAESNITLPSDCEVWAGDSRLDTHAAHDTWTREPLPDNVMTTAAAVVVDGKPMLRIVDRKEDAGVGVYKRIPVVPGSFYRERIRAKGGEISLYMNWYDKNGSMIPPEHSSLVAGGKDDFTVGEYIEQAPAKAASCQVWIYSKIKTTTEIDIADISFEDLGHSKTGSGKNLVDFDFAPFVEQSIAIPAGTDIFIRRQDVAMVLRPIMIRDAKGSEVPLVLHNDGLDYGAIRLTASQDPERTGNRVSTAIWSYIEEGISDDKAFAEFRRKIMARKSNIDFKDNVVTVTADGPDGGLMISADIVKETRLASKGMKPGTDSQFLSVNGKELGHPILEAVPSLKKALEKP